MNRRHVTILLVVFLPLALLISAARASPDPALNPTFANLAAPSMPFVPNLEFLNSTWFCAGVPNADNGLGGTVAVANPTDNTLEGHLTLFTDAADVGALEHAFEVPPRDTYTVKLTDLQPQGTYISAMVEIAGGGGVVEQRAEHNSGDAVSPCSNSTSSTWYFADNYTQGDSQEDIVITNPFPDTAIVDFTFAGVDSDRTPVRLRGMPIPGHSVLVIPEQNLDKDEAVYAVAVTASRGRVVAARSQAYQGERRGYSMSLGAPSPSPNWYFAGGLKDGTNFERFSIYNPGEVDVQVQPVFYGVASETFTNSITEITIPAGRVASFSLSDVPDLPLGRHGVGFSSMTGGPIVVEMAVTVKIDGASVTSVVLGVEQYFADPGFLQWSMAFGPTVAADEALVILNLAFVEATVSINALGPGGSVPVPGLEAVKVAAGGVATVNIPDLAAAIGHPLTVVSDQPIIVQRLLPRGHDLPGRSASLALPG
ncbi:MAG: DUF5719 family protein [Actinomycetota bacterium]|nr:DUF5719 family protein [Actinomycetota bacterium]